MLLSASIQVQNGLAAYTTWTSIATLINLTIVLSYDAGMSESDAATLTLSLLSAEVLVWYDALHHTAAAFLILIGQTAYSKGLIHYSNRSSTVTCVMEALRI